MSGVDLEPVLTPANALYNALALRADPSAVALFVSAVFVHCKRRSAFAQTISYLAQIVSSTAIRELASVAKHLLIQGADLPLTLFLKSIEAAGRLKRQRDPAYTDAQLSVIDAEALLDLLTATAQLTTHNCVVASDQILDAFSLSSLKLAESSASTELSDPGLQASMSSVLSSVVLRGVAEGHAPRAASVALKFGLAAFSSTDTSALANNFQRMRPELYVLEASSVLDMLAGVCQNGNLQLAEDVAMRMLPSGPEQVRALRIVQGEADKRGRFAVSARIKRMLGHRESGQPGSGATYSSATQRPRSSDASNADIDGSDAPGATGPHFPMARAAKAVPAGAAISALNAITVAMPSLERAGQASVKPSPVVREPGAVTLTAPFVFPEAVSGLFRGSKAIDQESDSPDPAAGPVRAHASALGPVIAKTHREPPVDESERNAANVSPDASHRRSLRHLLACGRTDVALSFAGTDAVLQSHVLQLLLEAGQFSVARAALRALAATNAERASEAAGTSVSDSPDVEIRVGDVTADSIDQAEAASLESPCDRATPHVYALSPSLSTATISGANHWSLPLTFASSADAFSEGGQGGSGATRVLLVNSDSAAASMKAHIQSCIATAADGELPCVVAIDAEWRPDTMYDSRAPAAASGGAGSHSWPVSIVQLAVGGCAFIVDLLSDAASVLRSGFEFSPPIGARISPPGVASLRWLFNQTDVIFLGFGAAGDITRVAWSHPQVVSSSNHIRNAKEGSSDPRCVELGEFMNALARSAVPTSMVSRAWADRMGHHDPPHSLSAAAQCVLGRSLRKTQQVSDWQCRPLTNAQLEYAALDALVVEAIYDVISAGAEVDELRALLGRLSKSVDVSTAASDGEASISRKPVLYTPYDSSVVAEQAGATLASDPAQLLGPSHVAAALERIGCDSASRLLSTVGSPTAETAAVALDVDPRHIVKSLSFMVGDQASPEPVIVLVPGDCKVNIRAVASVLRVTRTGVRMATPDECVRVFGYVPGSFPPFGYRSQVRTVIHAGIRERAHVGGHGAAPQAGSSESTAIGEERDHGFLYAGGGSLSHMVKLTWEELLRGASWAEAEAGTGIIVADIVSASGGAPVATHHAGKPTAAQPAPPAPSLSQLPPPTAPPAPLTIARPRFICDGMLGRLTRWLRVVGVDAEGAEGHGASAYLAQVVEQQQRQRVGPSASADAPVGEDVQPLLQPGSASFPGYRQLSQDMLIAWAHETGRILLTRDRKILQRRPDRPWCALWFLPQNDTLGQFRCVTEHFHVTVSPESLMSRCAKCNGLGYEYASREDVAVSGQVPEKVMAKIADFWRCRSCGHLYWEGHKFASTREAFTGLFA